MSEKPFTIADDESLDKPVDQSTDRASADRILALLAMIEDPDQSLIEINKKIAMEIAHTSSEIALSACKDVDSPFKLKALEAQIKSLRELSKTLQESEQLAKRDVLNFDGPKFEFVLSEIIKLFKKALQQTKLLSESQVNDVLRTFKDLLAVYDAVLRKETERITSKP